MRFLSLRQDHASRFEALVPDKIERKRESVFLLIRCKRDCSLIATHRRELVSASFLNVSD